MRPRLLDLFCGAGGCSVGYHDAGFDVVGVDVKRQRHYPYDFIQGDALWFLDKFGTENFDAIHASPPCQLWSSAVLDKSKHRDYITPLRPALEATDLPYVIENIPGAPIRADYKLCGCVVGLNRIERERWFETNWGGSLDLRQPCYHAVPPISVVGHDVPSHQRKFGRSITTDEKREAMGIDWMSRDELSQAIPPLYTELIGRDLIAHLGAKVAA